MLFDELFPHSLVPESVPLDRFYVTASSQAYLDFFRALHIQIVHIHNATKAYLVVHRTCFFEES